MHLETDVLVVGSGPAGLAAALALSTYGVKVTVITKRQGLAQTPRAHVTNQRTFEIFRDLGIESQAVEIATRYSEAPDVVYCESLAGREFARWRAFGTGAQRIGDYTAASPCEHADLAQNLLEPMLLSNCLSRGANVRFNTEYISHTQDDQEVRAIVIDRPTGASFEIIAKFLIGADGANSQVVQQLDLPMEGQGTIGYSLNIYFEADLADLVSYRPAFLYCMVSRPKTPEDLGLSVLRPTRHWHEWLLTPTYTFAAGRATATADEAIDMVRSCIGIPNLKVRVKAIDPWNINSLQAKKYSAGRVICIGDAVHRHSPANGLGSNIAIQDAYNLAWKVAFVLAGRASRVLLDTYDAERIPVGKCVVARSTESLGLHALMLAALDFDKDMQHMPPPESEQRQERIYKAVAETRYNFNAHGIEMNHIYASAAIKPDDGLKKTLKIHSDLYYSASTQPGCHIPHAWIQMHGRKMSTLDVVGNGRFTLLTGHGGEVWIKAAARAAQRFRITVDARMIGPSTDLTDLYGEWQSLREIEGSGCLLVRPDGYIAMRQWAATQSHEAEEILCQTLSTILGLSAGTDCCALPAEVAEK